MNKNTNKSFPPIELALLLTTALVVTIGYIVFTKESDVSPKQTSATSTITPQSGEIASPETSIEYTNTQYGFNFSLPESWKGYSSLTAKWEGYASVENTNDAKVEEGPLISIRHPQWSMQNPRQDIPIMIFTISQWDALQQEKFGTYIHYNTLYLRFRGVLCGIRSRFSRLLGAGFTA